MTAALQTQLIGERVVGGLYAEHPRLAPEQQLYGEDLRHHVDFRAVYATLLVQIWLVLRGETPCREYMHFG